MAETRLRRSVASAIVGTLLAAVLVGPAGNSVVAAQETALSGGALIRIVHVSPDAGPIDVYVDATPALRDVAFGEVADIRPLPAGTHHFRLVPTRGEDLRIDDLTVKSGEAYELAAVGRAGDDHLSSVLVPIDLAALRTGQARLRVVNAAQGTAALRLRLQGLDLLDRVPFTDASRYATVEAGSYELEPRAEDPAPWYRPVRPFQASPRTEIQEGLAYSFYAVKRAETGPVQFVTVGTPIRSMRVATIVEGPCGEAGALSVADLQPLLTPGTSSGSDGSQIETSVTTLHGTLVDIFSGVRSLVVDQVDAGGRQRIACGVVGGAPLPGDGALVIGLQEVGGSGDAGVAYLVPDAGGDTTITVFVGELAAGEAETPKIESDELIADVYAGTCHDHELIPVASLGSVDTPRGPILGSPNAAPVSVAAAIADRTVSELLAHEHVVIIRTLGTDTSEDLACGEILGVRRSDGALIVALRPTSGSMVAGLVYLSPRQDGRTAATVFVGRDLNAPRSRSQTMTTGEHSGAPGPGGGSAPANGATTGQSSSRMILRAR